MGEKIGPSAYSLAEDYWDGTACDAAGSIEVYGNGCEGDGGFIPHLSMIGCPEPGGTLQVRIQRGAPSGLGFLLVGLTQTSIPLGGGCELLVPVTSSVVPINMSFSAGVPGSGGFSTLFTPSPATVPGTQLTFQAAVIDLSVPSFYTLSNGLALTIE